MRPLLGIWVLASLYAQPPEPRFTVEGRYTGPTSANTLRVRAEPVPRVAGRMLQQLPVGADGKFTLTIPAGRHRIVVTEWPNGRPLVTKASQEVMVTADIKDLEIQPLAVRSLRVTVRPTAGATATGLVILNPLSRGSGPGTMQAKPVGEDGSAVMDDVAPDRYVILAEKLSEGTYIKAVLADGRDVTATGLDLENGSASQVELVLAEGGTLTGQVVDARGEGVAGARVSVSPTGVSHEELQLRARGTAADDKGRFRMSGLAPGRYAVGANNGTLTPASRPEVEVRVGAEAQVSVQLVAR